MWFLFALLTALCWGAADLFYKKGSAASDPYSHLKTSIMVGFVMGLHAVILLLTAPEDFRFSQLFTYLPVSATYILSMTIGYFGLRYMELSIASPVQNTSGALTALLCFVFFRQEISWLTGLGIGIVTLGIVLLAVLESREERRVVLGPKEGKTGKGFLAIVFPLLYCLFDSLGTFGDAVYLDEMAWISETSALIAYELTFLFVALGMLFYITVIKKQKFRLAEQKDRGVAALLETAGQYAYVYAMSGKAIVAAPLIATYSIFSVLLSRIFLKEKLTKGQYLLVAVVLAGIAVLGLAEGE